MVGAGDDHHGRLRRLLPDYAPGSPDRRDGHVAGVGIIGALAQILASLLVPSAEETAAAQKSHAPADNSEAMARELAEIKHELALLRRTLAEGGRPTSG